MNQKIEKDILTFQDHLFFSLYTLYFILKPFYLWDSGLPQISDVIMILLIVLYLIKKRMVFQFDNHIKELILIAFIFVAYVTFTNIIWMLLLNGSSKFFTTSAFYIYNFLVVFILFSLYHDYRERIIEITYKSTLISVVIQMGIYLISGGFSGGRVTGSFNNPNQLGYYALLTLALLLLTSQRLQVKIKWFILGVFSSAILCFSSLSKAAMLSYIGMLCIYVFSKNRNKKLKRNFIIIISMLAVLIIITGKFNNSLISSNELYNSVKFRIDSIGSQNDDNLEHRGYYRITDYPEYWILGAGEGEYTRFREQTIEFHSTLGNMQVSYGIVGLSLFTGVLLLALRLDKFRSWYIIMSIMIYGLSHNGIRNTLLWILITLIASNYDKVYSHETQQLHLISYADKYKSKQMNFIN